MRREEWDDRIWTENMKRITAAVAFVVTGFVVGALFGQNLADNSEPHREEIPVNESVVGA